MKRRGFLKSLLGVAALAAHAKFGSLVPIGEPEVETTLRTVGEFKWFELGTVVTLHTGREVALVTAVERGTITIQRGL